MADIGAIIGFDDEDDIDDEEELVSTRFDSSFSPTKLDIEEEQEPKIVVLVLVVDPIF